MQTTELRLDWLRQLENSMAEALTRATTEDCKHLNEVLLPMLPEVLQALKGVIISPDSTPTVRMRCIELVMGAWSKCIRSDLRQSLADVARQKSIAMQTAAQAAKTRARADEKKLAVISAKERMRFARKLAKHASIGEAV